VAVFVGVCVLATGGVAPLRALELLQSFEASPLTPLLNPADRLIAAFSYRIPPA
jgi:hypothetical protein